MQARQGLYAPMSRRVMVVGTEALGASLGEAATGADLGGSSKYSNIQCGGTANLVKLPQGRQLFPVV